MKKKERTICKYERCRKKFDRKDVARQYGKDSNVFLLGYCSAQCYTRDTGRGVISENNAMLQNLLTHLDTIHCHKCGKTAEEFVRGKECLLGCLSYTIEDDGEFLYWTCPNCMKEVKR